MKLILILGLQGVGKSRYIAEHYPDADRHSDIEDWWKAARVFHANYNFYQSAEWTKAMYRRQLLTYFQQQQAVITAELTGLTVANQTFIASVMNLAEVYGYEVEILYLKPLDVNSYIEAIEQDRDARDMFRAYNNGGGNWREPDQCPYFENVQVVQVDHSQWFWADKRDRWDQEAWADHEEEQRDRRAVLQGVG